MEDELLIVGEYEIRRFNGGEDYWIEHESGEGMQVFCKNFEKIIEDYFKSEF